MEFIHFGNRFLLEIYGIYEFIIRNGDTVLLLVTPLLVSSHRIFYNEDYTFFEKKKKRLAINAISMLLNVHNENNYRKVQNQFKCFRESINTIVFTHPQKHTLTHTQIHKHTNIYII